MHRNTYLIVSILAVLAALVVGVNLGKKISPASQSVTPTPIVSAVPESKPTLQTFVDTACGFSLEYGSEFSLLDSASGSAILNNAADKNKSIVMTCQTGIPRPALPADKVESLTLATTAGSSVSAKLYHDQSPKDGTLLDALIFTHPTSKSDIFIAGHGESFNNLIKTIQVIQ